MSPAQEKPPGGIPTVSNQVDATTTTPHDSNPVYDARPVKRRRASKKEMRDRDQALTGLSEEHGPCSVRHIFYRAVVSQLDGITKDQSGYTKVQRAVLQLRRRGEISYSTIVDNTRWRTQATVWNSPEDVLRHNAANYRRNLWADSEYRVEVWVESDSIAGTIAAITNLWAVPMFVCRGQSSETFAHSAAEDWNNDLDRIPVVLYVGDHDPAGLEIETSLMEKLTRFSHTSFAFVRLAVTWEQIEAGDLPGTKPKKRYGFPRAVEAEALPPQELKTIVDSSIGEYADHDQIRILEVAEKSEREIFLRLAEGMAS